MSSTASLTGAYPVRPQKIEVRGNRRQSQNRYIVLKAPKSTTCATSPPAFRSACSPASPASPAPASRRWSSTRCSRCSSRSLTTASARPAPTTASRAAPRRPRHRHRSAADRPHPALQNPATYTGVFTHIRDLFAAPARQQGARLQGRPLQLQRQRRPLRGLPGRRHPAHRDALLPDVYVVCEECSGRRYNRETLEVKYKGASIADVLDMTVSQACEFWATSPRSGRSLRPCATSASATWRLARRRRRYRAARRSASSSKELAKKGSGRTIYILDEPTTGLHFDDIKRSSTCWGG